VIIYVAAMEALSQKERKKDRMKLNYQQKRWFSEFDTPLEC
jgi:hypothetical protein